MNNVYIIGAGATPVAENYTSGLTDLGVAALRAALADTGVEIEPRRIGALYVANMLGEVMAGQGQLGALIADAAGLSGCETVRVEAAGASGGLALRQAMLAVASGAYDLVAVVGVEKATDRLEAALEAGLALASDGAFEADQGVTLTSQWALLMRRYMHEYGYSAADFAPFPVNAHANAMPNRDALYRFAISADKYRKAAQVASPLNMLDCATVADGAAALLIAGENLASELATRRIRIAGSAVASDRLALHARRNPLELMAAGQSATAAMAQARVDQAAIDVLELTDPHGIAAALALEACGFVAPGAAPRYAAEGGIARDGATPLATAGGYKARGDIGGASGVYQAVEVVRQLRGASGATQVPQARVGMIQCLGGVGATAVSHVLVAE